MAFPSSQILEAHTETNKQERVRTQMQITQVGILSEIILEALERHYTNIYTCAALWIKGIS